MTYDQCMAIINYLNDHVRNPSWYTWSREWTWAEIGFFAAWLGFELEEASTDDRT